MNLAKISEELINVHQLLAINSTSLNLRLTIRVVRYYVFCGLTHWAKNLVPKSHKMNRIGALNFGLS